MKKRCLAVALCVLLLAGCTPAFAGVETLDRALSRWMDTQTAVRFSASAQLQTWMPFPDETVAMFNGVLKHLSVEGRVTYQGDNSDTDVRFAMDGAQIMSLTETLTDGVSMLQTSLLPNRTLTSQTGSAIDALTGDGATPAATVQAAEPSPAPTQAAAAAQTPEEPKPGENAAEVVGGTDEPLPAVNTTATSDTPAIAETTAPTETPVGALVETNTANAAADSFSMLDAVEQLQTCYQALTDGIQPIATEKRSNYNIKGIGAGKWSRIARLTEEQSEGLLPELRAVLACGLNDVTRALISQITFQKGFIVALYQNADQQDLCVYMKGTVTDPDGTQRKLVWQWAFTSNGLKRKDTLSYTLARLSGAADSLNVEANWTQESRSDLFSLSGKTETTLKRAKVTDKDVVRVTLDGSRAEDNTLTCKGELSRETIGGTGEDTVKTAESANVDLLFTPTDTDTVLSGTVTCQKLRDKIPQMAFEITLAENAAALQDETPAVNGDGSAQSADSDEPTVTITGTDTAEPTVTISGTNDGDTAGKVETSDEQVTSLEQITDEMADETESGASAQPGSDYLVGTLPVGVTVFTAPQNPTTVNLDTLPGKQLEALLTEAAQNLAAKLLPAIAALPAEDAALLKDGMSDQDYAAFLSLLGTL